MGRILTHTFGRVNVGARLVAQEQTGILRARFRPWPRRIALALALAVRELQGTLNGTGQRRCIGAKQRDQSGVAGQRAALGGQTRFRWIARAIS